MVSQHSVNDGYLELIHDDKFTRYAVQKLKHIIRESEGFPTQRQDRKAEDSLSFEIKGLVPELVPWYHFTMV